MNLEATPTRKVTVKFINLVFTYEMAVVISKISYRLHFEVIIFDKNYIFIEIFHCDNRIPDENWIFFMYIIAFQLVIFKFNFKFNDWKKVNLKIYNVNFEFSNVNLSFSNINLRFFNINLRLLLRDLHWNIKSRSTMIQEEKFLHASAWRESEFKKPPITVKNP